MKRAVRVLLVVLIIFVGGFALARFLNDNASPIQLQFLYWRTYEVSTGVLLSLVFLGGILLSTVFLLSSLLSKTLELRRLRRENSALQRMIEKEQPQPAPESTTHSSSSK